MELDLPCCDHWFFLFVLFVFCIDGNPTQLVESQTEPSSHGTPTRIELERERERNRLLEEEIRRLQEHMRFQSADPVETVGIVLSLCYHVGRMISERFS